MQPYAVRQFSQAQIMPYLQSISAQDTGKVSKSGNKVLYSRSTKYYIEVAKHGYEYWLYYYQRCPC